MRTIPLVILYTSTVAFFRSFASAQVIAGQAYTVSVGGRSGCETFLSVDGSCGQTYVNLWNADDNSGHQHWTLTPVYGKANTYTAQVGGRTSCTNILLSSQSCAGSARVDLYDMDDGSGRQEWIITPVSGKSNVYNIQVSGGRNGCITMLSVPNCGQNFVDLWNTDDGSGHQQWTLTPVGIIAGQAYTVSVGGRNGCETLLSVGGDCGQTYVDLWDIDDYSGHQHWTFTPVNGKANTYTAQVGGRTSCANVMLSCDACSGSTQVNLFNVDDGSGRQEWVITPVSGQSNVYNIVVSGGRSGCDTILSVGGCGTTYVDLWNVDDGSGHQQWTLTPATGGGIITLAPLAWRSLDLTQVKPSGWLLTQLQTQANGLAGHLQEFYNVVQNSYWIGGNSDYSNLNEGGPYWFNGIVPLAYLLNDPKLINVVHTWVNYIVQHQEADGWLGPEPRTLWGRFPALLGLMQFCQAEPQNAGPVISAIHKFLAVVLNMLNTDDPGNEDWSKARWQDLAITVEWMLEYHPDGQEQVLSDLLTGLKSSGDDWKAWFSPGTFPTGPTDSNPIILNHGVNNGQALKSEAVAYRFTHDQSDIESSRQRVALINQYHGRPSGIFGCDEHLAGLGPSRGSEICTIVESMYSFEYLYSVIGDNNFADQAEQLAFNALPGGLTQDMWAHQYLEQTNQIWSKNMNPSVFATDGPDSNIFGLAPNYPCCTVNHGQGWPKFVMHMFMVSSDNGTLAAILLGPATVTTMLANNNQVSVTATTNYPFSSKITYIINANGNFNFAVRIPGWVKSNTASFTVNGGGSQTVNPDSNSMLNIAVGRGQTTVTVTLPFSIRTETRYNGAISVYNGPLTYAINIPYTTKVLATYYEGSKDNELDPSAAWGFAINPNSLHYNGDAGNLSAAVFSDITPPVTISATVCPITWNVVTNTADEPPQSPVQCTGPQQQVNLQPFGATHLRIAEIPVMA